MSTPHSRCLQRAKIFLQDMPTHVFPKASPFDVYIQNKEIAFLNSGLGQGGQAPFNQHSGNARMPVSFSDGEMAENPASAFMSAENSTDYLISVTGHKAKSAVPLEIDGDRFFGIRFLQAKPLRFPPEFMDPRVVSNFHRSNRIIHFHPTTALPTPLEDSWPIRLPPRP